MRQFFKKTSDLKKHEAILYRRQKAEGERSGYPSFIFNEGYKHYLAQPLKQIRFLLSKIAEGIKGKDEEEKKQIIDDSLLYFGDKETKDILKRQFLDFTEEQLDKFSKYDET